MAKLSNSFLTNILNFKEIQIKYVEDGFNQIIEKLKERKKNMILNFIEKYDSEIK